MRFIDLKRQYAAQAETIWRALENVFDHGEFILGPEVHKLEEVLASYVGVNHCISVANGTDSLLIALMALGIGPGDEVITVPFTFVSTAEVVALRGAKPVFVDICRDDYTMDVEQLASAITSRTRAIIPVSLFGQMAHLEKIVAVADRYGIPVIEDGAQSFGATRHGMRSCGASLIGSTSFFPSKPLGCYGDGGALFTDDDALAAKMRAIRNHGGQKRDDYQYLGTNSRLDTIQAAILLAKLPRYSEELQARTRIANRYSELLQEVCEVPIIASGNTHIFAQYTIRCEDREEVARALKERAIPFGIYYPKCLHQQPAFAYLNYGTGSFPVAEEVARQVLSLPMHPWLTEAEQDRVVDAVQSTALALIGS